MLEALIISFFAAPIVFGVHRWFEAKRQKQRKLAQIKKKLRVLEIRAIHQNKDIFKARLL